MKRRQGGREREGGRGRERDEGRERRTGVRDEGRWKGKVGQGEERASVR